MLTFAVIERSYGNQTKIIAKILINKTYVFERKRRVYFSVRNFASKAYEEMVVVNQRHAHSCPTIE